MMDLATIRHLAREQAGRARRAGKKPVVVEKEDIEDWKLAHAAGKTPRFPFPNLGTYVPAGWKLTERDPFSRFEGCAAQGIPAASDYISALNAYFRAKPYRSWFDFYEQGLNGLGASYYGNAIATALHTDIASCLATNPTWSRLQDEVKERLKPEGVSLWHRLVRYLDPQIILWSTARRWLDPVEFEPLSDWMPVHSFTTTKAGLPRRPLIFEARWYQVGLSPMLIGFAPAAQKPFGSLSHNQKREAGCRMLECWNAGVLR